jgi:hypothetical protein
MTLNSASVTVPSLSLAANSTRKDLDREPGS